MIRNMRVRSESNVRKNIDTIVEILANVPLMSLLKFMRMQMKISRVAISRKRRKQLIAFYESVKRRAGERPFIGACFGIVA